MSDNSTLWRDFDDISYCTGRFVSGSKIKLMISFNRKCSQNLTVSIKNGPPDYLTQCNTRNQYNPLAYSPI